MRVAAADCVAPVGTMAAGTVLRIVKLSEATSFTVMLLQLTPTAYSAGVGLDLHFL